MSEQKWKLVPVEPTQEMLDAGSNHLSLTRLYKAMLAAAPEPAPQQPLAWLNLPTSGADRVDFAVMATDYSGPLYPAPSAPADELREENERLREHLSALGAIAAQAHRHRGNKGKEAMFLAVIEERVSAALTGGGNG